MSLNKINNIKAIIGNDNEKVEKRFYSDSNICRLEESFNELHEKIIDIDYFNLEPLVDDILQDENVDRDSFIFDLNAYFYIYNVYFPFYIIGNFKKVKNVGAFPYAINYDFSDYISLDIDIFNNDLTAKEALKRYECKNSFGLILKERVLKDKCLGDVLNNFNINFLFKIIKSRNLKKEDNKIKEVVRKINKSVMQKLFKLKITDIISDFSTSEMEKIIIFNEDGSLNQNSILKSKKLISENKSLIKDILKIIKNVVNKNHFIIFIQDGDGSSIIINEDVFKNNNNKDNVKELVESIFITLSYCYPSTCILTSVRRVFVKDSDRILVEDIKLFVPSSKTYKINKNYNNFGFKNYNLLTDKVTKKRLYNAIKDHELIKIKSNRVVIK